MVTLGIIGVVSAMTVPSLMQNHQRKTYVTQLHKFYNELSQALVRYQTDKNALSLSEAGLTSDGAVYNFFNTYFKVINKCETRTPCLADAYKNMSGKEIGTTLNGYLTLASGTSLAYRYHGGVRFISLYVDINGRKGPNIAGRDMFAIYIYKNGYIDDAPLDDGDAPLTAEQREAAFEAKCNDKSANNWFGCFGKILNDNWEMTY